MGNQALEINGFTNSGGTTDIHITTHGSDWYFTVAAVMTVSTLAFWGLSMRRERTQRLFYYLAAAICLISAIAYFTQGSNLGWTPIRVEWRRSDSEVRGFFRQIFYVRWIDELFSTSLILLTLFLSAGVNWPTILYTILIAWVMVVNFLIGALVQSTYKWGYFTFATVAYLFIAYTLLFPARQLAALLGGSIYRMYQFGAFLIIMLWLLYPIAWGVSEGGNVIAPDSEAVFYGIIDLLSKPLFCGWLIWGHHSLDVANLGINVGTITTPNNPPPTSTNGHGFSTAAARSRLGSMLRRKEKAAEADAEAGATNGHQTTQPQPDPTV